MDGRRYENGCDGKQCTKSKNNKWHSKGKQSAVVQKLRPASDTVATVLQQTHAARKRSLEMLSTTDAALAHCRLVRGSERAVHEDTHFIVRCPPIFYYATRHSLNPVPIGKWRCPGRSEAGAMRRQTELTRRATVSQ